MPVLLRDPDAPRDPEWDAKWEAIVESHRPAMEAVIARARVVGNENRRLIASICDPALRRSIRNQRDS